MLPHAAMNDPRAVRSVGRKPDTVVCTCPSPINRGTDRWVTTERASTRCSQSRNSVGTTERKRPSDTAIPRLTRDFAKPHTRVTSRNSRSIRAADHPSRCAVKNTASIHPTTPAIVRGVDFGRMQRCISESRRCRRESAEKRIRRYVVCSNSKTWCRCRLARIQFRKRSARMGATAGTRIETRSERPGSRTRAVCAVPTMVNR